MGIAEKKPDTLVAIHGEHAARFEQQTRLLMAGELPVGWKWIASSRDTVVAMSASEPVVYYKEFLPRDSFERIKAFFRGDRCRRARRQADILREAGLPTPEILCWGRGRTNHFLISQGFAGTGFFHYVKAQFPPPLNPEQIREKHLLLEKAGALIGRMHSQGIVHGDIRQNNLLVGKEGNDFRFCLIDNESNRKWPFIPKSRIIRNLVQFAIIPDNFLTRTDILRLFLAYSTIYPRFSARKNRSLLRTVYARGRWRTLESRTKWEMKNCRACNMAHFQGEYVAGGAVAAQLSRGVDPAQWFRQGNTTLKQDKNITVKLLSGQDEKVIAKRFTAKHPLYFVQIWLKKERVLRLWEMSHCFQALAVPVAAPLGYVLEGKGMWRTVSYFYSRYLDNSHNLVIISRDKKDCFPAWLAEKKMIVRIARQLATLHNNGLYHGDTKWANILANAESGEFWLIDLDGAGRTRSPLDRGVRKDLSRFMADMIETGLSQGFLSEFITEYCGLRKLNRNHVMKKIHPHIEKTLARHNKKKKAADAVA